MKEKKNVPKKGAARKLAADLKELGSRPPPQAILDRLKKNETKKIARPDRKSDDLEV